MKDIMEYFVLNVEMILVKLENIIVVLAIKNGFTQNYFFLFLSLCCLFCIFYISHLLQVL